MIVDQFISGNKTYYLMNNVMRILFNKKLLSYTTTYYNYYKIL